MENLERHPLEAENEKLKTLNDRLNAECIELKNRLEFVETIHRDTKEVLQNMQNRCLLLDGMVRAFECILNNGQNILSKEV